MIVLLVPLVLFVAYRRIRVLHTWKAGARLAIVANVSCNLSILLLFIGCFLVFLVRHIQGVTLARIRSLPASMARAEEKRAAQSARERAKAASNAKGKAVQARREQAAKQRATERVRNAAQTAQLLKAQAAAAAAKAEAAAARAQLAKARLAAPAVSATGATSSSGGRGGKAACPCASQHGRCRTGARCWFRGEPLDLCLLFVRGKCRFGSKCKLRHDRSLAELFARLADLERLLAADDAWLRDNTRVCPKCRAAIERTEGCPHMRCAACNAEFDWRDMADCSGGGHTAWVKQRAAQARDALLEHRRRNRSTPHKRAPFQVYRFYFLFNYFQQKN